MLGTEVQHFPCSLRSSKKHQNIQMMQTLLVSSSYRVSTVWQFVVVAWSIWNLELWCLACLHPEGNPVVGAPWNCGPNGQKHPKQIQPISSTFTPSKSLISSLSGVPPSAPCCLLSTVISKWALTTLNFCTQSLVSDSQQPIWGAHFALEAAKAMYEVSFTLRKLLFLGIVLVWHVLYTCAKFSRHDQNLYDQQTQRPTGRSGQLCRKTSGRSNQALAEPNWTPKSSWTCWTAPNLLLSTLFSTSETYQWQIFMAK